MSDAHYLRAPLTQIPSSLLTVDDYAEHAKQFIAAPIYAHIAGGAGLETTLQRNSLAFEQWQIMPKALADFSQANTQSTLLGQILKHPLLLGPAAYQTLAHPQGELASAQAADACSLPMVCSTLSSYTLEDIATSTEHTKWFQLYIQNDADYTLSLVRRAEAAGYTTLVITIDVPVTALRYGAERAGFALPHSVTAANLVNQPAPQQKTLPEDASIILNGIMRDAPHWETLRKLREHTGLPILLKGILNPQDALLAQQYGFEGVIVSNHGGRSLDGFPATVEVMPHIRNAVGKDYPLLLDSGIRSGLDIFKAIAMGANAVLIGRPIYYALAVAGALGVAHMLRTLTQEFEIAMALAGCPTIASIDRSTLFTTT